MGKEIERKFLVREQPDFSGFKGISVIQAYLLSEPGRTVRIRIAGKRGFIAVKSDSEKGSFGRYEWEYDIPVRDAYEIMELCIPGKIEKTRFFIPYKKHTWEVDVFHGGNNGLIVAEIELESESETFEKPAWIGEEVTGNPDYFNSNLIK